MLVFASDRHRGHDPQHELEASTVQDPFEHPGRAEAIRRTLVADPRFSIVEPADAGTAVIEAVHDPGLVRFLETAWAEYQIEVGPRHDVTADVFHLAALRDGMGPARPPVPVSGRLGWWCFETTTPLTEGTYDAARSAVDCAVGATNAVLGGERSAYALCRPPGHHAAAALYGGYCFFNNAAIAAHHAVSAGHGRVSIVDVDYHHGNGTQQIFYRRGDVQFVSLHADPSRVYPYVTGHADETGAGPGLGSTLNLPLAAGADDAGYLAVLERAIDAVSAFDPGLVIVSLGLDAYADDPICDLALTVDGFTAMGRALAELDRPTVVVQEGGYATDALGELATAFLGAFA